MVEIMAAVSVQKHLPSYYLDEWLSEEIHWLPVEINWDPLN